MKLLLTGRHMTVSDTVRSQIDRKLARLQRLLDDSAVSAQCVLTRERQGYSCELTVPARGDHMLHGLGRDARLTPAVAAAVEKVSQQAQRLKDKWKTRRKGGAPRRVATVRAVTVAADAAPPPRVVRTPPADVKPMRLEDAILRLESGPAAFLVFRDATSNAIAVLYRRPDGAFGLIEPEA